MIQVVIISGMQKYNLFFKPQQLSTIILFFNNASFIGNVD